MTSTSTMPSMSGTGSQPLPIRQIPSALVDILAILNNRCFRLTIGAQSWDLQIASVSPASNSECIDSPEADRSALPLSIEANWLGHGFTLWCQLALLDRTLHAVLPSVDPAVIPQVLFDAVAFNAAAIWLAALPDQDSLRLTDIKRLLPAPLALAADRSDSALRLHGTVRQAPADCEAIGTAYPIAIDIPAAFSAALGKLLPPVREPKFLSHLLRPALLDLPLRLQCEVGCFTLPYRTLAILRQGDVLFFNAYTDPEAFGLGAISLRLCYRSHALARASIQQPGHMVITGIDMNDKKSISYEDDLPEDAATAFYGRAEAGHRFSGTDLDAEEMSIFGDMDDFGLPRSSLGAARGADVSETAVESGNLASDGTSLRAGLAQLPLQLLFDIGECEMNMRELQALRVGSVIKLATQISEVVRVTINGRMIASGELVEVDGKIGVILARLTDNP